MGKSIVVGIALIFGACVYNQSEQVGINSSGLVCQISDEERNNPEAHNRCCIGTEDNCSDHSNEPRIYGKRIGRYLGIYAHSNGACTGGGSGEYQCVRYAKDEFWNSALNGPAFGGWGVAANGLIKARELARTENLFVFNSGSSEPPRETDLLIYQNVDRNGNLFPPSDSHPGHASVVSKIIKENGRIIRLGLIEENWIASGNNGELCDQNLEDSVMRKVAQTVQSPRH